MRTVETIAVRLNVFVESILSRTPEMAQLNLIRCVTLFQAMDADSVGVLVGVAGAGVLVCWS
jgi:hypothetical protein